MYGPTVVVIQVHLKQAILSLLHFPKQASVNLERLQGAFYIEIFGIEVLLNTCILKPS